MSTINVTTPNGTESADELDDFIREVKSQIVEKVLELTGSDLTTEDPARISEIIIPAGGLNIRNSADSATVASFTNTGVSFPIGSGGASLPYSQGQLAADQALTSSYVSLVMHTLAAGTWLLIGQVSVAGVFTGGQVDVRLWDSAAALGVAQLQYSGNTNMQHVIPVFAVAVLGGTTNVELQAKDPASVTSAKGGATGAGAYTRLIAVRIA